MPYPETWINAAIEEATEAPCYPLVVPESVSPPFVVYYRDGTEREISRSFDGDAAGPLGSFIVEIYADGFEAVKTIADQIRAALHDFNGETGGLTIDESRLIMERDGTPVFMEGRDRPTYVVEQNYAIRWQE